MLALLLLVWSTLALEDNPDCVHPFPFCNLSLPFATRAADLVSRLTTAEKIVQLSSGLSTVTEGVPRLGVDKFAYHSEGLHGLRTTGSCNLHSTLFPQVTGMAATGNQSLMLAFGELMGVQARGAHNHANAIGKTPGKGCGLSYWSPTMNVYRDPRWGRGQESVSEDPYLNGQYAIAFVRGMQGQDKYLKVGATCKHFWAYSLEDSDGHTRHNFNANVSQRDANETYLPAFKACVQEASPAQVMCQYSSVNGIPACLHGDIQNGVMREQWGYEGFVVSDCDSIKDVYGGHHYTDAVNASGFGIVAGCDLDCGSTYAKNMAAALARGVVEEKDIDVSLTRIFTMRFKLGEFDPPSAVPWKRIPANVTTSAEGDALALQAARESIVLLANKDSILPLTASKQLKVAVVGPFWNATGVMMGAKNDYNPISITSVYEGIRHKGVEVSSAEGCSVSGGSTKGFQAAQNAADHADVTVMVMGIDGSVEGEAKDRKQTTLPGVQEQLIAHVKQHAKKLVVVLLNGGSVSPAFKDSVSTVVEAFEGGQSAGTAIADVLFGDYNPSGVLPYTMYPGDFTSKVRMSDMDMRSGPGRTYRFYTGTPLWPFGFGLSYTNFSLSWSSPLPLSLPSRTAASTGGLSMTVVVENTGKVAGAKVVQAFLKAHNNVDAPTGGSMFAFDKIFLQPGEKKTLTFQTSPTSSWCTFCTVDIEGVRTVRPGAYTIFIGAEHELEHHFTVEGMPVRMPLY